MQKLVVVERKKNLSLKNEIEKMEKESLDKADDIDTMRLTVEKC